jgi:GTP1/Obg family GTP-binding protein
MEIKGKAKELLVKQLKTWERDMQELTNSIKRSNLTIMGIEEEEVQTKRIHNIVNKIITENFPNLESLCPFRYRKPPGHQTNLTKIELPWKILSLKQQAQRIEKDY